MSEIVKKYLMEMLLTGIRGLAWPKVTHLIVIITDKNGTVIFRKCYDSSGGIDHAEIKMLKDEKFKKLAGVIDSSGSSDSSDSEDADVSDGVNIVITLNYSPCWECASKIIEFYNISSIKNLTIRFAHPYNTRNENDKERNKKCLKDLNQAGIRLEAMDDDSWCEAGVRSDVLNEDPKWKEMIREMRWLYKGRRKSIRLEDYELDPDWKEEIITEIQQRDEETKEFLEELLTPSSEEESDVEVLTQEAARLSTK